MKEIWQKFKRVKSELKQLNNAEFKGVTDKVKDIRAKLKRIQESMNDPQK